MFDSHAGLTFVRVVWAIATAIEGQTAASHWLKYDYLYVLDALRQKELGLNVPTHYKQPLAVIKAPKH